jgi:putative transposase
VDEEGFREILAVEVDGPEKGRPTPRLCGASSTGPFGSASDGLRGPQEHQECGVRGAAGCLVAERCTGHFERNVLSHVAATSMAEVAEDLKAVFRVRRKKTARVLAEEFKDLCEESYPKAISVFKTLIKDELTYLSYPESHHPKLRTANMLKRLFNELKRRTRVVGVFPNETSASILATEIALRSGEV